GVEYSTAPGSTYPTPVRQVGLAIKYLVDHSEAFALDPNAIVLAGDSAGAQIAAQTALIITDADYASSVGLAPAIAPQQLRAAILASGAFDMTSLGGADGVAGWFANCALVLFGRPGFPRGRTIRQSVDHPQPHRPLPAQLHHQRRRRPPRTPGPRPIRPIASSRRPYGKPLLPRWHG